MFDYVGAILSYLIIAIALFGGKFDNMSTTALGGEISRVCIKGLCLYLFQYPASIIILFCGNLKTDQVEVCCLMEFTDTKCS